MNGAIYVSDSGNTKLMGSKKVDSTYAAIKNTCPNSCPLKDKECYATQQYVGMTVRRLEKESKKLSALEIARAEAKAIDLSYNGKNVPAGRDLRLHVSGDSRTIKGTRLINSAIGRWKNRNGGIAWSYTHAWMDVPRKEWSNVSILASINSLSEVPKARRQGYAPAIIVSAFENDKAFTVGKTKTKWIPCPAQTKDNVGCSDCRLCMKADWLFETNRGIAFAAHGIKKESMKRRLKLI